MHRQRDLVAAPFVFGERRLDRLVPVEGAVEDVDEKLRVREGVGDALRGAAY